MIKVLSVYLLTIIAVFSIYIPLSVSTLINNSSMLASTSINFINITIYYSVWEDYGVVVYSIILSDVEENYTSIEIPLISNNISNIAVYDENGKPLVFDYSEINGYKWIEVMVANVSRVIATYGIEGLFSEISIGSYSALLNLTSLVNYTFVLNIELEGVFEVIANPDLDDIEVAEGITRLRITKPDEYLLTILAIYTPPLPTTTPTTQTTPQTTPPVTTPPETISETITPEAREAGLRGWVTALVAIVIMIAIAVIAYVLVKRK